MFFKKKFLIIEKKTYDAENKKPAVKASICTGEKVAGFRDIHSGKFEDIQLIRSEKDLEEFKKTYGIDGDIETIY
ncbi:MAG: aspartate dehydrogenase [Lachnospiraceae bacterium]|nr:aspartate dehydrogenase [Lachnospiraceae bacterium]